MSVTIKSYRKEREKEILDGLQKSLDRVGAIVERQAKINVTEPPSPVRRSGELHDNIIYEVGDGEVVIGTNILHGKYLEFGTSRMPPYPWLFPAVELKKPEIIEALKGHEFTIE